MTTEKVDWNEAWQAARERTGRRGSPESWDRRAPSFAKHAARSGYVEQMLARMRPEPDWTVLDVGCGSGTLAVPLARQVRSVVALDFSARMLELLAERCAQAGLGNVRPVLGAWEDDWDALGIPACEVAVASRSLSVPDLRAALLKLERAARRRAFVTAPVGDGPFDRRVLEAAGRPFAPGPDYVYPYQLLRQLGRTVELDFIRLEDDRLYADLDEAAERHLWMLPEVSGAELAGLRRWLERELAPAAGGLRLRAPRTVRWAVLSWSGAGDR